MRTPHHIADGHDPRFAQAAACIDPRSAQSDDLMRRALGRPDEAVDEAVDARASGGGTRDAGTRPLR
jgi:hypothetical protein